MTNEITTSNLNGNGTVQKKDNLPLIVLAVTGVLFLICVGVAFVFACPYFQSKTVIVLEPDYSLVSNVDTRTLEETARILNERCEEMNECSLISFSVSKDNQIIGRVPPFAATKPDKTLLDRITAIGLLEFVDFGSIAVSEGTMVQTDFEHPFFSQQGGKTWHTVMTNAEIKSATVMQDQIGLYRIDFTLTEKGKNILFEHTSKNINKYLGIVIDKVVISVPQINSAIPGGEGSIAGQFTKEAAEDLATYLNAAPLPIPLVIVETPGQ